MKIQRKSATIGGVEFKPVSKSCVLLAKQVAEDALTAKTAIEVDYVFQALEGAISLSHIQLEMLTEAKAALAVMRDGEVQADFPDTDIVKLAKRAHDLSQALDADTTDITIERLEDLVAGLENDLARASTAVERATRRAEYAHAKGMAAGLDPHMLSKRAMAHPPKSFSEHDLDFWYAPGTRILKSGEDRDFPAEDTDIDTLRATMVSIISADAIAQHSKDAANKSTINKMSAAQREKAEIDLITAHIASEMKGAFDGHANF